MTRVEEFDTFYNSTRRQMLHLTYALCGDRTTAAAAVADAYQHAWQRWSRLRGRDPYEYLRNELWRVLVFQRGKHPWRRRHEEDSDLGLLVALQKLATDTRRLVVLQYIGGLDLAPAARDVGMTDGAAAEATQNAVATLEQTMATDLAEIEQRLQDLARITNHIALPRPHGLRRQARRRNRRNTAVAVVAAIATVLGAGLVATENASMGRAEASSTREQVGADTTKVVPAGAGIDTSHLLDKKQISRLNPQQRWSVDGTGSHESASEPYAVCTPRRFADRDPRQTYVRSFSAGGENNEGAVEAVEVSRDRQAAEAAYDKLVEWYANCAVPRVQLLESRSVERPDGKTRILRLRRWDDPVRTITVGVSRTGVATSVLVHSTDGKDSVGFGEFAATTRASLTSLCDEAGGRCPEGRQPIKAQLPEPSNQAKPFLSIVDLPPVADVEEVWAGTETMKAQPNPAATACDKAKFTGKHVVRARSRVFVIPESQNLPEEFGLSETIASFDKPKAAKRFVRSAAEKISSCEDDNLSATVSKASKNKKDDPTGARIATRTWKLSFEINKNKKAHYRMALVRRGRDVTQLAFSPTKKYDIAKKPFDRLAFRSGERLEYMR